MKLREPYKKRAIRFLGTSKIAGWRMKIYGISYVNEFPSQKLVESAQQIAFRRLIDKANTKSGYGVGFIIAHEARGLNSVLVDWWGQENVLYQHVYESPPNRFNFRYVSPTGITACVWELYVLSFERQAWIDHVLRNGHGPNLDAYMSCVLNADA